MSGCRCGHRLADHARVGSCFLCPCGGYKPANEDGPYRSELRAWAKATGRDPDRIG